MCWREVFGCAAVRAMGQPKIRWDLWKRSFVLSLSLSSVSISCIRAWCITVHAAASGRSSSAGRSAPGWCVPGPADAPAPAACSGTCSRGPACAAGASRGALAGGRCAAAAAYGGPGLFWFVVCFVSREREGCADQDVEKRTQQNNE